MNLKTFKERDSSGKLFFGLSPWLLIGVAFILGLVILVLAARNSGREKAHITQNLLDRADALIWALEAGARTNTGGEGTRTVLQPLIEETARQPGVEYLAIIDETGRVLAHSDQDKVGTNIARDALPGVSPDQAPKSMLLEKHDSGLFEVYRGFSPLQGAPQRRHGRRGHGMMHWYTQMDEAASMAQAKAISYAFVGFDREPFTEALAAENWNNLLAAAVVAAFGLAGLISLFWAHHYKRSRRKLKDTQALAGEVVTSLPLGLITSDPEGKVNMINDSALKMLHTDKKSVSDILVREIPGLDWEAICKELSLHAKIYEKEMELVPEGGKRTPLSVSASEIRDDEGLFLGNVFILRDLAEVKRLQAEVQKNERLTALGNLAAGVAHEIRNPLSSIKGLATYLTSRMQPAGPEEEAAKTMVLEVNRLNRVVSELLEFANPGAVKLGVTDINDVISRALRLADTDMQSKGIRLRFVPDTSFPKVFINAERLTQALLNLFLNAIQAMEPGGELGVSVGLRPDDEFSIVVSDTGKGMSKETLSSIFTPYFTTKPSGTGLGLAIVHQIVEGHGGRISVASTQGAGSMFTIFLPLHKSI